MSAKKLRCGRREEAGRKMEEIHDAIRVLLVDAPEVSEEQASEFVELSKIRGSHAGSGCRCHQCRQAEALPALITVFLHHSRMMTTLMRITGDMREEMFAEFMQGATYGDSDSDSDGDSAGGKGLVSEGEADQWYTSWGEDVRGIDLRAALNSVRLPYGKHGRELAQRALARDLETYVATAESSAGLAITGVSEALTGAVRALLSALDAENHLLGPSGAV